MHNKPKMNAEKTTVQYGISKVLHTLHSIYPLFAIINRNFGLNFQPYYINVLKIRNSIKIRKILKKLKIEVSEGVSWTET